MNILIAFTGFILLAVIALGVMFYLAARRAGEIIAQVTAFITPAGVDKPSPLASSCQVLADMTGRSIVATAKSTFMGLQSGEARAAKAIQGDIAEDLAGQVHPLAGVLLHSFPALRKTIRRNPALLDMVLSRLPSGPKESEPASKGNGQSQFQL